MEVRVISLSASEQISLPENMIRNTVKLWILSS